MPAGSQLSAAHCHGFRRIRTNENSAVYMRARRDRASICPCMAQTSRANCYNSIESPLYYYGFVTNPHRTHRFIHIIPTRTVHKLSVNRLCRQGSKRTFHLTFFDSRFFIFRLFFKALLSGPVQKHFSTLFTIAFVDNLPHFHRATRIILGGLFLCLQRCYPLSPMAFFSRTCHTRQKTDRWPS